MRLRRAIGILGNIIVCLGYLCLLFGALLLLGAGRAVVFEAWWWNVVLGHGVEPWWWNWVVFLGAVAVGAVLMFGIGPVWVNWAGEGDWFSVGIPRGNSEEEAPVDSGELQKGEKGRCSK